MAVKIAKLEAHSGYYFESGEKLITAKPIMQLEVPDIVEKYLKNEKGKKTLFIRLYLLQSKKISKSVI